MSKCNICGKWAGAHATLPGQSTDHLCHGHPMSNTTPQPLVDPLAPRIAEEVRIMLGSATELHDGIGDVVGYQIKTGALHRILGMLSGAGHPVTIAAKHHATSVEASARALAVPEHPNELAAQARECAESLRLVSQTRRVQEACDVLEQCARALAAIPAESDALGYATQLAQAIFDKHFAHEPHYASGDVVWSPLDDLLGVLTQIDNMVAGVAQKSGGVPAGFVLGEYLHKFMGKGEGIVRRFYNGEDQSLVDAGAWIQEANQLFQVLAAAPSPSAVQPLSEAQRPDMVLRAARELCRIHAGECQVNEQDTWNLYADQFKRDADAVLQASHGIVTKEST